MDPVEKAARAICESEGINPDRMYQTNEVETSQRGNSWTMDYKRLPEWHRHISEAKKIISVLKALNIDIKS